MRQLKTSEIPSIRAQILFRQDGICPICGKPVDEPCLDHAHKSAGHNGQIRGVLCRGCNALLGRIENNCRRHKIPVNAIADWLSGAADYLESTGYDMIHPSEAPKPRILSKRSYDKMIISLRLHGYNRKIPEYRMIKKKGNKHWKPAQKMNKTLEKLYHLADIDPVYYKF